MSRRSLFLSLCLSRIFFTFMKKLMEWIILIVFLGLVFDYTNGFHDAANVVSTVIATKVLRPLTAVVFAGILNTIGATHTGPIADTMTHGLVLINDVTPILVFSSVIGAIFWNLVTWYFGIPSSSSYALVGGLVGAAWQLGGSQMILWKGLLFKVVIPMIVSPFLGFILAFVFMKIVKYLHTKKRIKQEMYHHLQIGSSALVALSHGLNDAQKSMAIITLGLFSSQVISSTIIPFWVVISCALMMGLGTLSGGFRIIRTVGFEITPLVPSQGFAAEASASCIILSASFLGMPISSTQMIVGSVAGVGAAKGLSRVRWTIAKKLVVAWFLTLPGAALVSYLFFLIFKDLISS